MMESTFEDTPMATRTRLNLYFDPALIPQIEAMALRRPVIGSESQRDADLVRARRESYPVPGENPVPEPGTLSDDLRRRDFGLNALALVVVALNIEELPGAIALIFNSAFGLEEAAGGAVGLIEQGDEIEIDVEIVIVERVILFGVEDLQQR